MSKTTSDDYWQAIQEIHFGRRLWQQRSPSGLNLLQALVHKASDEVMLVELQYDHRVPHPNSNKPWPRLTGLQVYAPVDPGGTWAGLDRALTGFGTPAGTNGQTHEPAPVFTKG